MRHLYGIFTILLFTMTLTAQSGVESETEFKHTITFGGSLSLSSQRADDDNKSNSFSINPYVMRRVDRNWQVGLCLGYGRSVTHSRSITSPNPTPINFPFRDGFLDFGQGSVIILGPINTTTIQDIERTSTLLSACIFGRFTINPANRLSIFVEPLFSYGSGKNNQEIFNRTTQGRTEFDSYSQSINLGSRLGLTYAFNDHWRVTAFAGNLGYNYIATKDDRDDRFETASSGASLDLSLSSLRLAVEFSL